MDMTSRTGHQIRLALGALTAAEWDSQGRAASSDGFLAAYLMSSADESALDLVVGLIILARAGLMVAAARQQEPLAAILARLGAGNTIRHQA